MEAASSFDGSTSHFPDNPEARSTGFLKFRLFRLLAGEIFELKAELNNEKKEKRKEAVKKVIAAMTVGKDVR